jgi:hypothetical protein
MSARDDATHRTTVPRLPGTGRRAGGAVLAGAGLGFLLAALLVQHLPPGPWPRFEARVAWEGAPPAAAEWPRAPRPGESARCETQAGCVRLVVGAPRGKDACDLAAALQRRRLSGVGEGAARRAAVRAQWRVGRLPEPEPWLSQAARTAALVRGRLLLVMLLDPRVPAAIPPPSAAAERARARLEATEARVMRLALAAQPDSLETALTACATAESDWLRQVAMHPSLTSHVGLEAAWRWHERSLAPLLDGIERGLEARLTPAQEALVPAVAFDRALRLERLAPDPSAIFFVNGRWADDAKPVPVAATWALLLGPGTLAGALAGLVLAAPRRRRRERAAALRLARGLPRGLEVRVSGLPAPPRARDAETAWRSEISWLHVVSGPDRTRVAHGVGTLAAGFAARGERVLAVDAGRDLRLHERFGGDARWGLGECLDGEVPLLGAVQAAGRPGFYLLACGGSGLAGRWEALSGVLEEARRHFDRVILALGVGAPGAAALPLGGRVLEAWWAEPGPQLPRRAVTLGDRLGISFTNLNLDWLMQAEREVAGPAAEASAAVEAAASPALVESPEAEWTPPAGLAEAPVVSLPAEALLDVPPPVLDCDREVRDRLRFMVWMKRVQAERRSAAPVEVGTEG